MKGKSNYRSRARRHFGRLLVGGFVLYVVVAIPLIAHQGGVLTAPGCDVVFGVRVILFDGSSEEPRCLGIPLLSDIPSLTLGLTSVVAVLLNRRFVRKLGNLRLDLYATGLWPNRRADVLVELDNRYETVSRFRTHFLLGGLVILGIGVWFYNHVFSYSVLFRDFALKQGLPAAARTTFREEWWANYEVSPVLAASWIFAGVIGACFALYQAFINMRYLPLLWRAAGTDEAAYVPAWLDERHGWGPLSGLFNLSLVGMLNFALSYAAILYLLSGGVVPVRNTILATVAIVGVAANVLFITALLRFVFLTHRRITESEREELRRCFELPDQRIRTFQSIRVIELMLRAEQLERLRTFPFRGFWRYIPIAAAALVASANLLATAATLLVDRGT